MKSAPFEQDLAHALLATHTIEIGEELAESILMARQIEESEIRDQRLRVTVSEHYEMI